MCSCELALCPCLHLSQRALQYSKLCILGIKRQLDLIRPLPRVSMLLLRNFQRSGQLSSVVIVSDALNLKLLSLLLHRAQDRRSLSMLLRESIIVRAIVGIGGIRVSCEIPGQICPLGVRPRDAEAFHLHRELLLPSRTCQTYGPNRLFECHNSLTRMRELSSLFFTGDSPRSTSIV